MTKEQDLLFEIGCEEIPAKLLPSLAQNLHDTITINLRNAQISFGTAKQFATPRRIAVLIEKVSIKQPEQKIERRGPALSAAYDAQGKPTPALQGFLKSCGITVEQLTKEETPKGTWLLYRGVAVGKKTTELLPDLIKQSCKELAIPRPMRWGSHAEQFIRPVQWVVLLFGEDIIPAIILTKQTDRITYGHRFMDPLPITIERARDYEGKLLGAKVVAHFDARKKIVEDKTNELAAEQHALPEWNSDLLNEVCGLVEWPVPVLASFEPEFLMVPREALIAAMQAHQKCFPLTAVNMPGAKLLPYFITVSNIESKHEQSVAHGNEKVMRARLSDAKFFYVTDLKHPLEHYLEKLKTVTFQHGLGSMFDKSQRIADLATYLYERFAGEVKSDAAYTAGLLCKADLATSMVGEFPELQGIMGFHYYSHHQSSEIVAKAIRDHYKPRSLEDNVQHMSPVTGAVAIADKIDTLVGIFGINQKPTGEKDPFGLRRAALGIIKIILENKYALNLQDILGHARELYAGQLKNPNTVAEVSDFILERLRFYYRAQNISTEIFNAVVARQQNDIVDFQLRVDAVKSFLTLTEAETLVAANKRVSNILAKENISSEFKVDEVLLREKAEKDLWQHINNLHPEIIKLRQNKQYETALKSLAALKSPIDAFFDHVMVMVDDKAVRNNRLALLQQLRELFLEVADVSLLQ